MTKLLGCPFCGGDVSFHKDEECPGCHLIQCGQCRAFFDFATGADPGNDCASVDALRVAIAPMWNTRAQLAAIQGGMGEAVEVRGLQWLDTGHYRKKPPQFGYNSHDWNPLMTVAQHQRITAAMAAEVERLKQQIENYRSQFGELHIARNLLSRLSRAGFEIGDDLAASIIALRAELAEVKGREAVQVGWALTLPDGRVTLEKAYPHWIDGDMGGDGYSAAPLYTTPQPAPAQDVAGLVEALRVAAPYVEAKFASEQDRYAEEYARLPETAQVRADIAKVRASLAAHDKQSGEDA